MTTSQDARPNGMTATAAALAAELRAAVRDGLQRMTGIPESESGRRPRPGSWSPKEIVGHLIDSASNNHGRFVRGALGESLVFAPYDQEAWVRLHHYQKQPWPMLLERWAAFNEQVAVSIENVPEGALTRPRAEHNFDRIAWKTIAATEPTTLEYFVRDYIGHLRHHLAQVASVVSPRTR